MLNYKLQNKKNAKESALEFSKVYHIFVVNYCDYKKQLHQKEKIFITNICLYQSIANYCDISVIKLFISLKCCNIVLNFFTGNKSVQNV